LINVDFADLCAVTQGKHSESSLAVAEAKGESRAREVIEKLLAHPLIEGGQALTEASEVLICIAGGPELGMADVNRIMEQINRHCEQAHLIMGAAVDNDLQDHLIVTVVASRRPDRPETAVPAAAVPSRRTGDEALSSRDLPSLEDPMSTPVSSSRPSRFLPPPPLLTPEKREQLLNQQATGGPRQRKNASRLRQGQLPLEIISKGRFEKSEPTIHHGQDLDVPTYIRRGVALN
jgi:cell division protein FtsZ